MLLAELRDLLQQVGVVTHVSYMGLVQALQTMKLLGECQDTAVLSDVYDSIAEHCPRLWTDQQRQEEDHMLAELVFVPQIGRAGSWGSKKSGLTGSWPCAVWDDMYILELHRD